MNIRKLKKEYKKYNILNGFSLLPYLKCSLKDYTKSKNAHNKETLKETISDIKEEIKETKELLYHT